MRFLRQDPEPLLDDEVSTLRSAVRARTTSRATTRAVVGRQVLLMVLIVWLAITVGPVLLIAVSQWGSSN